MYQWQWSSAAAAYAFREPVSEPSAASRCFTEQHHRAPVRQHLRPMVILQHPVCFRPWCLALIWS